MVAWVVAAALLAGPADWAWAVSGMEKVRPGQFPAGARSASVTLAHGECRSIQVVAPASGVTARWEGTPGPRLYREAFVDVSRPSNLDGHQGLWPDPLIPTVDAFHGESRSAFPAESPAVVYVELCGAARGEVVLEAPSRASARIAVEARELAVTIPPTSTLPTSFGFSEQSIAHGHGVVSEELVHDYLASALKHRISPHGLTPDDSFLEGPAHFTTLQVRRPAPWPQLQFFYAKDEPSPAEIPLVLAQAQASPVPTLVTSPFDPRLVRKVGILCPNLNCFFSRLGPATCRNVKSVAELRRLMPGSRIWWYQSCSSHGCAGPSGTAKIDRAYSGWASYMVDAPAALNRAMGVLAFLEGIDGELYYDTVYAYDHQDPWTSVYAFGGNGDGTLFYPGTPARVGGRHPIPIESLRLKLIRDGLQDYELLEQLARAGDGDFARSAARRVVRSGYDIERSPAAWDAFHDAILERLSRKLTHP